MNITTTPCNGFMVTRKGRTARPGATLPRMRFQTLDGARDEAEAQAKACPGTTIAVFQEIVRVKADNDVQPPGASWGDSGGVPKAPDANGGDELAPPYVNRGRAGVGAHDPDVNITPESGEPRTFLPDPAVAPEAAGGVGRHRPPSPGSTFSSPRRMAR